MTEPECPMNVPISLPVATSRSATVLSPPGVSAVRPSGENAIEEAETECPAKVRSSLPVATAGPASDEGRGRYGGHSHARSAYVQVQALAVRTGAPAVRAVAVFPARDSALSPI